MINSEQLTLHISLMAAPIYAAFLGRAIASLSNNDISPTVLSALRENALAQAQALWLDTLEREHAP